MVRWLSLVSVACVVMAPVAASAMQPLNRSLSRLTPDEFAKRVSLIDDPLEKAIVLSTQSGHKGGQSMKGAYADDVHLRAALDRQTGKVSWQVWHDLINFPQKAQITAVHYTAGGKLHVAQPAKVEQWEDVCSPDGIGVCFSYMRVVFEIPDHVVQEIATRYRPGSRDPWPLRFKVAGRQDITGGLAPAEAAGLIQAVQSWQSQATVIAG